MTEEKLPEELSRYTEGEHQKNGITSIENQTNPIANWLETLTRLGLGEAILRFGTHALLVVMIIAVVGLLRMVYEQSGFSLSSQTAQAAAKPIETSALIDNPMPTPAEETALGIPRLVLLHTNIPTRPRIEVITYEVQPGDTVFGISEKFGLKPQTILWGNYYTLRDDPHSLSPGQELNILPTDGTYHRWEAGEGLTKVAQFYGVDPLIIVNYPGNHLNPDEIGDLAHPNIEAGTLLIIPGGRREFTSWSAPIGVTRDNPAIARSVGPGSCGKIEGGNIGYGYFIWPTVRHFLSGYDYSPDSNHWGIDIDGDEGNAIYAADAGVIVYAGWNDNGYGNLIIIDHGKGWQSLYAHLSVIYVGCGQSIGQGETIGLMGSTGRSSGSHLHFELMHTQYGKVNPWAYLPPP